MVSAPRFVSPLRWEPLPYLVLVALLVLTGAVRPESGIGYVLLLAAVALAAAWLVAGGSSASGGCATPTRWAI